MTLVFMIALSKRLPFSTMNPASTSSGFSKVRMTSGSVATVSRQAASISRAFQMIVPEPIHPLAIEPSVQHRTARQHDPGQVDGRRGHEAGGRRLVTPGGQDHPVERVAVQHLDQAEVGEVAVKASRGTPSSLLDRVHRELERDPAHVPDAVADALGQNEVVTVARREVGAGLGDPDHGFSGLQLLPCHAPVHVPLDVESGHSRIGRVVEPGLAAQASRADLVLGAHHRLPSFVAAAVVPLPFSSGHRVGEITTWAERARGSPAFAATSTP
jgi:hypothetical protein